MQTHSFRIDVGRWSLARSVDRTAIHLEPDPLVLEPEVIGEDAAEVPPRAEVFRRLLMSGEVRSRAELARQFGLSRARVTQILGPINKNK